MAVRKTGVRKNRSPAKRNSSKKPAAKGKRNRVPAGVIFWVLIFLALITTFFIFLPRMSKGIKLPFRQTETGQPAPKEDLTPKETATKTPAPKAKTAPKETAPKEKATPAEKTPQKPPETKQPEKPVELKQPDPSPLEKQPDKTPLDKAPNPVQNPAANSPVQIPAETRDQGVYFLLDRGGSSELILTRVNRKIKISDSPLLDSIKILLSGPTAEEKARNLVSFIPAETRIYSAMIRGNTAYLDFNEEFRYNTLGNEGSVAQLKQIVWTATEFPNVSDVQILIEGNRVDFLSEGIIIGSPIAR